MVQKPEIALLVSSFQRPGHLRRSLLSIALQRRVREAMEVVVTDDGSTDETAQLVQEFARSVDFPVKFTTHPHTTFQLSRCRNEGAAASTAPYLLFLDGDCVLPHDHVFVHLQRRAKNKVMAGDCVRLDKASTVLIDENSIFDGSFSEYAPPDELKRLQKLDRKARIYHWLRHPTKPKLLGNNIGIWRSDFATVNGYDENFEGWGCEDDDLRIRLRMSGVGIESILRWTHTYHLWHPVDKTAPTVWREGRNVSYLNRRRISSHCSNGLIKEDFSRANRFANSNQPTPQQP